MKRFLLAGLMVSLLMVGLVQAQSYDDGIKMYKKANLAKLMKDPAKEKKALEDAQRVFNGLLSGSDKKSLIMSYLIAEKLGKSFSQPDLLSNYIKAEHPGYPSIDTIEIQNDDRKFVKEKIRQLAGKNENRAVSFLADAESLAKNGRYSDALDKLAQAEKAWELNGIQTLRTDIKNTWSNQLLRQARADYKNKSYDQALQKCDQANNIRFSQAGVSLKKKIQKRIHRMQKRGSSSGSSSMALFIEAGSVNNIEMEALTYGWNSSFSHVSMRESGSVVNEPAKKAGLGFGGGLVKMFSSSFGVSLSATYLNQDYVGTSDYNFDWTWYNGSRGDHDVQFSDSGKISLIPINLNFVGVIQMKSNSRLNVYGGVSMYMTDINLETRMGYAVTGTRSNGNYAVDWFPFEFRLKENGMLFGANGGIDYEFLFSGKLGVYLGIQYFYVPKKEYTWEFIVKRYDGQFGYFYISDPSGYDSVKNFKSELDLSTFKVHFGFKAYL